MTKTTVDTRGRQAHVDAVVVDQRPRQTTNSRPFWIAIWIALVPAAAATTALVVALIFILLLLSVLILPIPMTIMNISSAIPPSQVSYRSSYASSPLSPSSKNSATTTHVVIATTIGPVETVFDWETEHCTDGSQRPKATTTTPLRRRRRRRPSPPLSSSPPYRRDVPDVPAMAWKDPLQNMTYLVSGDCRGTWANVASEGNTLDQVQHDCQRMIFNYSGSPHGWHDRSARSYANYEWLYAPFVVVPPTTAADKSSGNTTVYMLVHNEFHGWDRYDQGWCNATRMIQSRCWYNSVTLSVSHDGGTHFEHTSTPPTNMIAAPDHVYVANHTMYGVFSPSQLVRNPHDDYVYSFPVFVSYDGTKRGVTSMRTNDVSNPSSWRFLVDDDDDPTVDTFNNDAAYIGIWTDPYGPTSSSSTASTILRQKPAILKFGTSKTSFSQPVPRYIPKYNVFVMVGYTNFDTPSSSNHHFGISTSSTPWGPWSTIVPIQDVDINPQRDLPLNHYRGLYPSLLDHGSLSNIFDTIDHPTATSSATSSTTNTNSTQKETPELYLYWVQPRNKTTVHAPDMARDLVRQPVRLTLEEKGGGGVVGVVDGVAHYF